MSSSSILKSPGVFQVTVELTRELKRELKREIKRELKRESTRESSELKRGLKRELNLKIQLKRLAGLDHINCKSNKYFYTPVLEYFLSQHVL